MAEALIFTTKGNLPVADLAYSVDWFENDGEIGMAETYRLGDEIVRRSVHIHKKQGSAMGAEQVAFS